VIVQGFGHWIVTTFVERGATGYALGSQPSSPNDAKPLDSFVCVMRAGGRVDAVTPQHRGDSNLIEADELKKYLFAQIGEETHEVLL